MKSFKTFLGVLLALITLTVATNAATLNVPSGTYPTIQSAVNAANGGDIINIANGTYTENVIVTGAKNGITIQGQGSGTILDGNAAALSNPRIAFKIEADNVTIKNLKIQDYVYTGAEDVSYGSVTRGVAIMIDLATSLSTVNGVTVENCNYGVHVREGNQITIKNCDIYDLEATANATPALRGGIGIFFESNSVVNMDRNNILNNGIHDADRYGIWYGRVAGNVGADLTNITGNYIYNCATGTGLSINRIKQGDVFTVTENNFGYDGSAYSGNNINIEINTQVALENRDVTIADNGFFATISSTEIISTALFEGSVMYDIWLNNENVFMQGSDVRGTAAALETNTEVIVENAGFRYIRNVVNDAVTDAEAYHTGIATYSKVYVTNGTFLNTVVSVDEDDIYLVAQSTNAKLVSDGTNPIVSFNTSDRLSASWGSVDGFTLNFPTGAGTFTGISVNNGSANLLLQNNVFESAAGATGFYKGILVFDGADNDTIKNNTFNGSINTGIGIENTNTNATVVECNTFNTSNGGIGIKVDEIAGNGNISNIIIRQNTFTWASTGTKLNTCIWIDNSGAGTVSDITIGGLNGTDKAGNKFLYATTGIYLVQNDGNIVINYNGFDQSPNLFTAIENYDATPNLNAHFNYYHGIGATYTTTVPARIGGTAAANVEWLPIYEPKAGSFASADMDAVLCGFQPDITDIWVPVYTTDVLGNPVDDAGNEFFLTITAAVADVNTDVFPNNRFVYLSNGSFDELAVVNITKPLHIGIAPTQDAPLATAGGVTITNSLVHELFSITVDGTVSERTTIDGLVLTQNSNVNVISVGAGFDYITISNNTFNLTNGSVSGKAAVSVANSAVSRDNHQYYNNTFNLRPSNTVKAIDYGNTNTNVSSNIYIWKNNFTFAAPQTNSDIAVLLGSVSGNLEVLGSTFSGGRLQLGKDASNYEIVKIGDAGNHPTYNFPMGNSFSSSSAMQWAIYLVNNGGVGTIVNGVGNSFSVKQNYFGSLLAGIEIQNTILDAAINLNNIDINENEFSTNLNNGAIIIDIVSSENIDMTNNYWNSAYGPDAQALAPTWHDNTGSLIQANTYFATTNTGVGALLEDNENNYIFAPFWTSDPGSTPGLYTGTSFAPVYNNDSPVEYFGSLIFAIDETNNNGIITMVNGNFFEYNTIENEGKNLIITSADMVYQDPSTSTNSVNIYTKNNDADDNMFLVTGGDVTFNFLNFRNVAETLDYGINNNAGGTVVVDYCRFEGMDDGGNDGMALANTNGGTLNVQNTTIYNTTKGGIHSNSGNLYVTSCTLTGKNYKTEYGIWVEGNSNATIYNSSISGYKFNGTSAALYLNSEAVVAGTIDITWNEITDNSNGFRIGDNDAFDNYSNTTINNNSIWNNTKGLVYQTSNAGWVLNAEDNYWESDNGPEVDDNPAGNTQYNAYNVGSQGEVIETDANSTVDYLPWRRYLTSNTISKSAGARFAPIVVTNSANVLVANPYFANFSDADVQAVATNNVYVYQGTYTENWTLTSDKVNFIGRKGTYNATWINTPAAITFTNTYPASSGKGAGTDAPVLTSDAADIITMNGTADNSTFKGFVFDFGNNATAQNFFTIGTANPDNNLIQHCTFTNINTNDIAINFEVGGINGFEVTDCKFTGESTGQATWLYIKSTALMQNINAHHNDIYSAQIYLQNELNNIVNVDIMYNEFNDILYGVYIDPTILAGSISNVEIFNNLFKNGPLNESALFVNNQPGNISNAAVWSTIHFSNNRLDFATSSAIAVGFDPAFLAAVNPPSSNILATCNWWGDGTDATLYTEGPTNPYNVNGDGLIVSNQVDFTPWLNNNGNNPGTTFGFDPTGTCNAGERVYVNTTGNSATRTIVFPSMYAALNHPTVLNGTNEYIFIDDDYLTLYESVSVPNLSATTYFFAAQTATNTWGLGNYNLINGNLTLGGTNDYKLSLNSNVLINGNITIDVTGANGDIILNNKNLTFKGTMSNGDANRYVETNGTGYLIKQGPVSMTQYNFPVFNTGNFTPAYITLQETGFNSGNTDLLKIRANNGTAPQTLKSEGENGYSVNSLWTIDYTVGNSGKTNTNASVIFRYPVILHQGSFNLLQSYVAVWNPKETGPSNPMTKKWVSYKSVSSQNGSDGTQVTGLNLINNTLHETAGDYPKVDYAIFSGSTAFALNNEPAQAKNIVWTNASDVMLKFRWTRNDASAENWAIVAKEGSMTANSAITTGTNWTLAGDNFTDGYGYTDSSCYISAPTLSSGVGNYGTINFNNTNPHPSGAANVRVVASGAYIPSQSLGEITVNGLDQGKYYEFYVANYNGIGAGLDGTANFNNNTATLNPRNRKTLPAVYLGLDLSTPFKTANTNNYTLTDAAPMTASGDALPNYWYTSTVCQSTSPSWTAATVLRFQNYGNNTGTGWALKFSENNATITTTTLFTSHTTNRNITGNMKYYLVNGTDGDGKIAILYDNNQDVEVIVHEVPTYTIAKAPLTKTCETNNITVTVTTTSTPAYTLSKWQYSTDGSTWNDLLVQAGSQTIVGYGDVTNANTFAITIDPVFNSTSVLQVRAVLNDNTVCDLLTSTANTTTISIDVYDDNPLTAAENPTATYGAISATAPEVCDGTDYVEFTTNAAGAYLADAVITRWEYKKGTNPWTDLTGNGDGIVFSYQTTGTKANDRLRVGDNGANDITIPLYDDVQFRVVYTNGNCAVVNTSAITLNVIEQPEFTTTPNVSVTGTACASNTGVSNTITLVGSASANEWTTATWYTNANSDGFMTPLVNGSTAPNVTITNNIVAGTSTLTLTNIPISWNNAKFKVKFDNVGTSVTCTTNKSTESAGITVYVSPVLNDLANVNVCDGGSVSKTVSAASGTITSVSYQYSDDNGATWNNLVAGTLNGATVAFTTDLVTDDELSITNIPFTGVDVDLWDNRVIKAIGTNGSCDDDDTFVINVFKTPSITTQPDDNTVCAGNSVTFTYDDNMNDGPVDGRNTPTWQFKYGTGTWSDLNTANLFAYNNLTSATVTTGSYSVTINSTDIHINGINIRVKVASTSCATAISDGLAALTVNAVPVPPSPITITNLTSRSFSGTWNEVLTATHYDYQVSTNFGFTDTIFSSMNVPTDNPTVTVNMSANEIAASYIGTTVYVRVRSQNGCGEGPWYVQSVKLLKPQVNNLTPNSLAFGEVAQTTCSASQQVAINYTDLEEYLTITLPTGYKWSKDGTTIEAGTTLNHLTLGTGTFTTNIYIHFCPLTCGDMNDDVVLNDGALGNTLFVTGEDEVAVTGKGVSVAPATAASALYFTADNTNDFTFTWTNGSGLSRIVVIEKAATPSWTPTDDVDYSSLLTVTNSLTAGNKITGQDVWVVADGAVSGPINVSGLTANTVYHAMVFEYNSCNASWKYNTNPAVNEVYRLKISAISSPQTSHTSFPMTVSLIDRSGANKNNDVANPLNISLTTPIVPDTTLTVPTTSIAFGGYITSSITQTWKEEDGNYGAVITATTGNPTLSVLDGTSNAFTVYAQRPTVQARVIMWVGTPTCDSMDIKWTNGNGTRRLILVRKNALPENPSDLNTYEGNLIYEAGDLVGTGTYVVDTIIGSRAFTDHIDLTTSGTYYFRVIEYKGQPGLEQYLTTTASFNPRSRSMSCKDMNEYAGIDVTDFNLASSEANGLVTFRSTYEQNIAGFEINRMDLSNNNPSFENIGNYTLNKELEAVGNTTTGKGYSFVDKSSKLMVGKTYLYQVVAIGFDGSRFDVAEGELTINNNDAVAGAAMSVSDVVVTNTTINFDVAVASNSTVKISVYDINGNLLTTIADAQQLSAGTTNFNHNLNNVTSGTYVLVIDAGNVVATQNFQIVK